MWLIRKLVDGFVEWNNRPRQMTPDELAVLLRRMRDGEASHGEWDYFEALALADPELEPIRERALSTNGPRPGPEEYETLAACLADAEETAARRHSHF